jgi:murein endopeptidase
MRRGAAILVAGLLAGGASAAAALRPDGTVAPGGVVAHRTQAVPPPGVPSSCRVPGSALHAGSRALGLPFRGRLANGVPFPAETDYSFTWDFPEGLSPNPQWRRYGTEKLVLTVECVLAEYGAGHPDLARIGVADLSRRGGGPFGSRYGGLGHQSHQNGLDADVLYPRTDLCECPADTPDEIDASRAQELVDRFVRAGAQYVFVSPALYRRGRLRGPRGVVIPLVFHDDHMHVRIYRDAPPRRRGPASPGPE